MQILSIVGLSQVVKICNYQVMRLIEHLTKCAVYFTIKVVLQKTKELMLQEELMMQEELMLQEEFMLQEELMLQEGIHIIRRIHII